MTTLQAAERIEQLGPWFYEFDLGPHGRTVSMLPEAVRPIHTTRLEMVNRAVDAHFGPKLAQVRCIDVGCHEGYYSVAMARKGMREIQGVDVRESSLEKARFVAEALQLAHVSFRQGNCEDLDPAADGTFELCLFLGILYHLENPMLALRKIAAITKELCVIETQVADEVDGSTEWGSREWIRPYRGTLALIDESSEFYAENAETGASPLAFCPSPKAMELMLKHAGFKRIEKMEPRADAYEQHRRGKRVVWAAYK